MVHQIGIRVSCQDSSSTGTDAFITSSFSTTSGTTSSSNSSQLLTPFPPSTTSTTCGTDKTSFTMGILNIATPPSILTRHFPPASGKIPEGSLRCELFSSSNLSILRQTPTDGISAPTSPHSAHNAIHYEDSHTELVYSPASNSTSSPFRF